MASDDRLSAKQGGYMELRGARKDGDCRKLAVPGGISLLLGCCNLFEPKSKAVDRFRCEDCEYHLDKRDAFFGR